MMQLKVIIFVLMTLEYANSFKILGVFPTPSMSHYILGSKLMKGLAEAGHDVTMISPYKLKKSPKNGTFTDVVLDGFKEHFDELLIKYSPFELKLMNPLMKVVALASTSAETSNKTLYHTNVRKLLRSNQTFDAVIMEQFSNDALKVFAHIYKCPLIILSNMGPNAWVNRLVANPQPVSYVVNLYIKDFSNEFTFFFRVRNLMAYLAEMYVSNWIILPKQQQIMFDACPDAPPLYDLYTNVSLVLLNSHVSLYTALPTVPNIVEIGGFFVDPPKKLSKELQDFLDGAKEGVIYFSLGSILKSTHISDKRRDVILKVFDKLQQKVLWKFEGNLSDIPPNVMIRKWIPQQDVLAHPNIKLFITHGGLLSITEAIYHGVPILVLPVFGDQPINAGRATADGYGLTLDYHATDFEKRFAEMIDEIVTNQKYKVIAKGMSKLYHDRPQKPMETAVYWIEYAIRHQGAPHLRVAGMRMPWYQYYMIDVIGVVVLSVLITLYIIRARNLMFYLGESFVSNYIMFPKHDDVMHKAFPDAPPLYDLFTNVSLVLLNSHVSLCSAVPVVPNMVEIGGFFIDPPKRNSNDLQQFLDDAKEGVIYFCMGSNLKSVDILEVKRKALLSVFGKLKQKVLWKFEEDLPEKPPNVMIKKWIPQHDVLAHPNIKLFITHGGLLSITEAIYNGVPILALTVFADQPANALRAAADGYGLVLNYHGTDFTEERLSNLINEILTNPKYKETAKRLSRLDTAVYWIEYVIRHRGAPHLRVAGIRMSWYKYYMVDVTGALILIVLIVLYSIKLVCKKLFCHNNKSNYNEEKIKKN